ncbi:MAG: hypothetical protein AAF222_03440 [Pseudomonadota bacterium]
MPKRVLVIDGMPTHRIRLSALLEEAGYDVATARDLFDVQGAVGQGDLVIVGLSDGGPGQLVSQIATAWAGANCPILCMDPKMSPLRRLLVLRAGARDALPYRASDELILAMTRRLIREGEAKREAERRRITAASFGLAEAQTVFDRPTSVACIGAFDLLPERLGALLGHTIVRHASTDTLNDTGGGARADAFLLQNRIGWAGAATDFA